MQRGIWTGTNVFREKSSIRSEEQVAYILKTAADELAPALALLFQLSMDQGEIPQDWKQALVVPIFKKGDKHQPSNYRPVSLTSITCKLLEHIIHRNIMHHFDQHRVLCDDQHEFRKKPLVKPNYCQQSKRLPLQQPRHIKLTSFCLTLQMLLTKSPTQDNLTNWTTME